MFIFSLLFNVDRSPTLVTSLASVGDGVHDVLGRTLASNEALLHVLMWIIMGLATGVAVGFVAMTRRRKMGNPEVPNDLGTAGLYKSALDEHAIFAVTDARGVIVYVNDKFCQISGYSRDEVVGKDHRLINSGHHPKSFFADLYRTIHAGKVWHGQICNRAKDGSTYWVQTTIVPQTDGQRRPSRFIAIRSDITQQKQAEHALQQATVELRSHVAARSAEVAVSEQRFQALADSVPVGICMTDTAGEFSFVNPMWCQTTGMTQAMLMGTQWQTSLHPSDSVEFLTLHKVCCQHGRDFLFHHRTVAPDGRVAWVETRFVPVRDATGTVAHFVGTLTDLTAIRNAESDLTRLNVDLGNKNREMEQFVYSVSHDLKSPLVTFVGILGRLRGDLAVGRTDRIMDSLGRLDRTSIRMRTTIDELVDLSRIGRVVGESHVVDPARLVEEFAKDHAEHLSAEMITLTVAPDMPLIRADRGRLAQLFDNLLNNAMKFGCSGARREIQVGCDMSDVSAVRYFVRDFGPGIPIKYQEKVFGLFQRLSTTVEGTGVGLSIVQRIAQVHGGRVFVQSQEGHGATFWIEFPIAIHVDCAVEQLAA